MEWMQLLVLVHVLSAIIGIGPTFFAHVLTRKNQTVQEYRTSSFLASKLEYFPKIGGTIALLTGILLVIIGNYGSFMQFWLIGALVLYIVIQIVIIGLVMPITKKLVHWVNDPKNQNETEFPVEQKKQLVKVENLFYVASTLGVLLFVLMIIKPHY